MPRWLKFSALGVAAIVVAAATWLALHNHRPLVATNGAAPAAVPVYVAKAEVKDVPIPIRGIGEIKAFNTVTVKSRVTGAIVKINYRQGQYVHKGDLLLQIDPRPYQAQLEQAQADKAKDLANLENAKLILARYATLLPNKLSITQQQYDTQKATVDQAAAAVQADQAQIDAAQLNVDYSAIKSPIDGVTGLRLVDIGNLVEASAATPLVVVTQIKPIYVTFTEPEVDLDQIRDAMAKGPLEVLAYNEADTKQISKGTLDVINNSVDQTTGMVELEAEFANADDALWPGRFVNAHLVLRIVKHGVVVPVVAIQTGATGSFVYLVGPNSKVTAQPVKVLETQAGAALISSGLKGGDEVVTSGQFKLAPGVEVAAQSAPPPSKHVGLEGVGSGIGALFGGSDSQ